MAQCKQIEMIKSLNSPSLSLSFTVKSEQKSIKMKMWKCFSEADAQKAVFSLKIFWKTKPATRWTEKNNFLYIYNRHGR